MTLSEKDLEEMRIIFHAGHGKYAYNFLLPLLQCYDITWDGLSKRLLLSGELLAIYRYIEISHTRSFSIVKKFQRNNGIVMVDEFVRMLKIHDGDFIEIWHRGDYKRIRNKTFSSVKRHACETHTSPNQSMIKIYTRFMILVR